MRRQLAAFSKQGQRISFSFGLEKLPDRANFHELCCFFLHLFYVLEQFSGAFPASLDHGAPAIPPSWSQARKSASEWSAGKPLTPRLKKSFFQPGPGSRSIPAVMRAQHSLGSVCNSVPDDAKQRLDAVFPGDLLAFPVRAPRILDRHFVDSPVLFRNLRSDLRVESKPIGFISGPVCRSWSICFL